jgi:hypothetical protein
MKLPFEIINNIQKYIPKEPCYNTYTFGNGAFLLLNEKENIAIITNDLKKPLYRTSNFDFKKSCYPNMKKIFVDLKTINKFLNHKF